MQTLNSPLQIVVSKGVFKERQVVYIDFPFDWNTDKRMRRVLRATNFHKRSRVHVHMLRHSFATHLLKQESNLKIIQNLLGHDNIKTTKIETQVTTASLQEITKPFDTL